MEPMLNGNDFNNLKDGHKETSSSFKRTIIVHRFQSFTTPTDPRKLQKTRVNLDIPVPARVYQISAKDILMSGGYYVNGDVKTHTEIDIIGVSNAPGAEKQADQMTLDTFLFQVIGMPRKAYGAGGRVYTVTDWRQI